MSSTKCGYTTVPLGAVLAFEIRFVHPRSQYIREIQLNGSDSTINMIERENDLLPTISRTGIQKRARSVLLV